MQRNVILHPLLTASANKRGQVSDAPGPLTWDTGWKQRGCLMLRRHRNVGRVLERPVAWVMRRHKTSTNSLLCPLSGESCRAQWVWQQCAGRTCTWKSRVWLLCFEFPPSVCEMIHSQRPAVWQRRPARLYFRLMAPSSCPLLATLDNTRTSKKTITNHSLPFAQRESSIIISVSVLPFLLFPPWEAAASNVALRGKMSFQLATGFFNSS